VPHRQVEFKGIDRIEPDSSAHSHAHAMNLLLCAAKYYQALIANALAERWPDRAARQVQSLRLRRLVRHAFDHVPFYREHFLKSGVRPEDIRTAKDLWRISPISKEEVIAAGDAILDRRESRNYLVSASTTGTSGRPLRLYARRDELASLSGYMWSPILAAGVRPWHRIVTVASGHFRYAPPPYRCDHLRWEQSMEEWLGAFHKVRPHALIGQTEGIFLMARELLKRASRARTSVRFLFTFGWTLTDEIREVIRDGFGCDPIDFYGAMELIWAGVQCRERQGHHVAHHRLIAQVARPGDAGRPAESGQLGELIFTDLAHYTMPFIRYRIQDVGAVENQPCVCGRAGPRITHLLGRKMDILVSTGGKPVRYGALGLVGMQRRGVLADYQIIQEAPDRVRLVWVAGPVWAAQSMAEIERRIRQALGPVAIETESVSEIRTDPNLKRRRYIRRFPISDEIFL
jgi:phenylacetate-CoA ligase